jgi:hypothetical protein
MSSAQDPGSLVWIIFVIGAVVVVFWRTVIKLVLICVVALIVLGFADALRGLH